MCIDPWTMIRMKCMGGRSALAWVIKKYLIKEGRSPKGRKTSHKPPRQRKHKCESAKEGL